MIIEITLNDNTTFATLKILKNDLKKAKFLYSVNWETYAINIFNIGDDNKIPFSGIIKILEDNNIDDDYNKIPFSTIIKILEDNNIDLKNVNFIRED
jgi:hypothetical protein